MPNKRATLVDPKTGDRKAVDIGSGGEKDLFSRGYVLETADMAPSQKEVPATYVSPAGDRTTTAQSGKTQEELYKKKYTPEVNIYNAAYPESDGVSGATTSSTDATDAVNEVGKNIADEKIKVEEQLKSIQTPEYKEYTDYSGEFQNARDEAKSMLDARKANIKAEFEIREEEQRISNRAQTGQATMQLARMGAYGRSGSGINYMKQVQVQNERELNKLLVSKQQLLIQAEQAYLQEDYKLLNSLINENTRVTDQYNQIQSQMMEDAIKSNEEIERQTKFGWETEDRAMEKLSTYANSGIDINSFSAEEITKLEEEAGLISGTFEAIYNLNQEAKLKEDFENEIKLQTDIYKMLGDIPKGQVVEIGGYYYTGTKDAKLTLVTDGETNKQYVLTQDPVSGEVIKKDLGIKGKLAEYTYDEYVKIGDNIASVFEDGEVGGQCGEFVHQLVSNYPYNLNTFEEKVAQIDDSIGTDADQNLPQVGDVVIQSAIGSPAEPYGHVSVINSFDPETGIMTLSESNYYDTEIVSNTRRLNVNDKSVQGFFRGELREGVTKTVRTSNKEDVKKAEERAEEQEEQQTWDNIQMDIDAIKTVDGKIPQDKYNQIRESLDPDLLLDFDRKYKDMVEVINFEENFGSSIDKLLDEGKTDGEIFKEMLKKNQFNEKTKDTFLEWLQEGDYSDKEIYNFFEDNLERELNDLEKEWLKDKLGFWWGDKPGLD